MNIIDRVDASTHVSQERFTCKPPFPRSVKVEITSACNYRCSFCATKSSTRKHGVMDIVFYRDLMKKLVIDGVEEVGVFLLGESFLVKNIDEYIRIAKECGIKYVFITTNGSLCKEDIMKRVIEAGLDSIKFSVNAGERDRYAKMHGVDAFDEVVDNIIKLSRYLKSNNISRLKTAVSSIYMDKFSGELESFREMILKYVDCFYYLPMYSQGGSVKCESKSSVGNPGRLENSVEVVPCWMLFNSSRVTWDGLMTACCFDHDLKFVMGDLSKCSLMDAWHSDKFVELRKKHLDNNLKDSLCAKCLGL